jgi:hypothetical protein
MDMFFCTPPQTAMILNVIEFLWQIVVVSASASQSAKQHCAATAAGGAVFICEAPPEFPKLRFGLERKQRHAAVWLVNELLWLTADQDKLLIFSGGGLRDTKSKPNDFSASPISKSDSRRGFLNRLEPFQTDYANETSDLYPGPFPRLNAEVKEHPAGRDSKNRHPISRSAIEAGWPALLCAPSASALRSVLYPSLIYFPLQGAPVHR